MPGDELALVEYATCSCAAMKQPDDRPDTMVCVLSILSCVRLTAADTAPSTSAAAAARTEKSLCFRSFVFCSLSFIKMRIFASSVFPKDCSPGMQRRSPVAGQRQTAQREDPPAGLPHQVQQFVDKDCASTCLRMAKPDIDPSNAQYQGGIPANLTDPVVPRNQVTSIAQNSFQQIKRALAHAPTRRPSQKLGCRRTGKAWGSSTV